MESKIRFRDLAIGETFEFDHSALTCNCGQLAHGPWTKTGTRNYVDVSYAREQKYAVTHKVGTINATVRRGESCGHPYWDRITRIASAIERQ